MADLYGEGASLLRGAGETATQAGELALGEKKLDENARQFNVGTTADILKTGFTQLSEADRAKKAQEGETERTRMTQAGETERQFTTLTPEIIKGLTISQPKAGWDQMKPGQKMQTNVLLGLMSAVEKANPPKSQVVHEKQQFGDVTYDLTMLIHPDGSREEIGRAPVPEKGTGAGKETPQAIITRIQKAQDQILKMQKEGEDPSTFFNRLKGHLGGGKSQKARSGNFGQALQTIESGKKMLDGMGFDFPLNSDIEDLINDLPVQEKKEGGKHPLDKFIKAKE